MINELTLEKFQGFNVEQKFRLAPLTLIFGPNSSGKSSIIRSLLFLKQSQASVRDFRPTSSIAYRGNYIDLANFKNTVHTHKGDYFKIGVGVDKFFSHGSQNRATRNELSELYRNLKYSFTFNEIDYVSRFLFAGEYWNEETRVSKNFNLDFDTEFPTSHSNACRYLGSTESNVDALQSALIFFAARAMDEIPQRNGIEFGEEISNWFDFLASCNFKMEGLYPELVPESDFLRGNTISHGAAIAGTMHFARSIRTSFQKDFENLRHIGPLRNIPNRFDIFSRSRERLLESDGGNLTSFIQNNFRSLDPINRWLQRLTDNRYQIEIHDYSSDEKSFTGDFSSLYLVDMKSNSHVSMQDAGVGLSQILPLIVNLTVGGNTRNSLVLIEQPELHLHPKLQSEVADLLISSSQHNNQVIAETHSEQIILRVQRRIKENRLNPKDVCVLYVDAEEDYGTLVTELRIDEDGTFLEQWPLSFVETRMEDLFFE